MRTAERMSAPNRRGFAVTALDAPRRVVLGGRHWFSRYQLAFAVEPTPTGSRVTAETRAEFPGLGGRLYRALVIGTGIHARVVRRMLRTIVRQSAASARGSTERPPSAAARRVRGRWR